MTSIIKVDNLQNQCGANIINENAGTITIGASGDTIALAAGASQSGFGRSGSVNWDTTPKTANFTGVSGEGYFVDTTLGAITIDLPATPAAGDIVAIADYANTSATNNITVDRNGSNIDGNAVNGTISINGQVYTLVYVDATEGWKTVGQTFNQITTAAFVAATGGTVTCCGDYKIHTFTGPGTFTVTNAGNPGGSTTVDYLVVAGGAAGGGGGCTAGGGGGGGAGGYRESSGAASGCYSVSPLGSGVSALPVSVQGYPITVGAGGSGASSPNTDGNNGSPSIFSTITSAGGGGGGGGINACVASYRAGLNGGSGGGASSGGASATGSASGGSGNTPPVAPSQGSNGGPIGPGPSIRGSSGGGGALNSGISGDIPTNNAGAGGGGATSSINLTPTARAGGGGGSSNGGGGVNGPGGTGGGGAGGTDGSDDAVSGTTNTGGGGGGASDTAPFTSGAGGSGIVIIRYKFQ